MAAMAFVYTTGNFKVGDYVEAVSSIRWASGHFEKGSTFKVLALPEANYVLAVECELPTASLTAFGFDTRWPYQEPPIKILVRRTTLRKVRV
jgi:hypothetical protein